jgi:plasmid stabilization system protein ParE
MPYPVIITPRAQKDIDSAYRWGLCQSQWTHARVEEWHYGLWRAIDSLQDFPARCAIAPESEESSREIRHLIYGAYRVLFMIDDTDTVKILHVQRSAEGYWKP